VRAEVDLDGVFVSSLLVFAVAAWLITQAATWILGRIGFYRFVWHRALFDMALFVIVWGVVAAFGGPLPGESAA
jgi:hypothetical protein